MFRTYEALIDDVILIRVHSGIIIVIISASFAPTIKALYFMLEDHRKIETRWFFSSF